MTVDVPDIARDAIVEFLRKYQEHLDARPHAIRSWQESWGIIDEEHSEMLRQLRKSKVDDPKTDKLLNDAMELAVAAFSSYVDLCDESDRRRLDAATRELDRERARDAPQRTLPSSRELVERVSTRNRSTR